METQFKLMESNRTESKAQGTNSGTTNRIPLHYSTVGLSLIALSLLCVITMMLRVACTNDLTFELGDE